MIQKKRYDRSQSQPNKINQKSINRTPRGQNHKDVLPPYLFRLFFAIVPSWYTAPGAQKCR